MFAQWRLVLVFLLALAGAGLAGLLLMQHHGESGAVSAVNAMCGDSAEQESGCDAVNRSDYSEFRGVPVASVGLFFYASIALLAALAMLAGPEARGAAASLAVILFGLALFANVVLFVLQL